MRYLRTIITYSIYISKLPIYFFSLIFPRDKKLWVFGAWFGTRYSDNSKYLFEYIVENGDVRALWISKNIKIVNSLRQKGYRAVYSRSLMGFYYMLRAGVVIVSSGLLDINSVLVHGAFKINLWHGAPMKKINFDEHRFESQELKKKRIREVIYKLLPHIREVNMYDLIVATSDYFKPIMASSFKVPLENVQALGYSRNDIFYDMNHKNEYIERLKEKYNYENLVAYLPTYRGSVEKDEDFDLFDSFGFNIQQMDNLLQETNSIMIIKLHYVDQQRVKNKYPEMGQRIIIADENDILDINETLNFIDLLITDYSGVYFDYLLLNKPVIFSAFDLEQYSLLRGLYEDYDFYTAGPLARNWNDVINQVRINLNHPDNYKELRIEKNKLFNKYHDGMSSKRIYEYCRKIIF